MTYIPKNKIKTGLYASDKEFVFKDTTDFYVGPYYKLYNGKVFTGQDQNSLNSKEIVKFEEKKDTTLIPKPVGIAQSPLFPTAQDYKNGFFARYFLVKKTQPLFIETDKKTYDKYEQQNPQVPWQLYTSVLLLWQLIGDINQVAQTNKNSTIIAEQRKTVFGLGLYLKENWTQYYKEKP